MDKPKLKRKQPTLRLVVEFSDQAHILLPEDVTLFCLRWLESVIPTGFSDVRITSEKRNHEIIMTMQAGSILRGKLALQHAEALENALQRYRVSNLERPE